MHNAISILNTGEPIMNTGPTPSIPPSTDTKAWWTDTVNAYLPSIYRFVRARVPVDAVDDLVQDTFVAAAQNIDQFDPERGQIWGWLCGIARRKIATFYRHSKSPSVLAMARSNLSPEKDRISEAVDQETPLPPEICERSEFCNLAGAALSSLDPQHRSVLLARYEEDLSLDEISQRFNRSRSATNSMLHRARLALRRGFLSLLHQDTDMEDLSS